MYKHNSYLEKWTNFNFNEEEANLKHMNSRKWFSVAFLIGTYILFKLWANPQNHKMLRYMSKICEFLDFWIFGMKCYENDIP